VQLVRTATPTPKVLAGHDVQEPSTENFPAGHSIGWNVQSSGEEEFGEETFESGQAVQEARMPELRE